MVHDFFERNFPSGGLVKCVKGAEKVVNRKINTSTDRNFSIQPSVEGPNYG